MEKIQLHSSARAVETDQPKKMRHAGNIPAVLYGHNVANTTMALSLNEFEKVLRKAGESTIIELLDPSGKVHNVLIKDVQRHYLTDVPIHVDFYEVKMTEKMTATVQLEFVGESHAVKAMSGTLVKNMTEVEVECFPGDLPSSIEVDIRALNSFEDAILVKDLKIGSGVEVKAEPEEMIAKVDEPRDVEAELAEPVGGEIDLSKVEGIAEAPEAAATEEKK